MESERGGEAFLGLLCQQLEQGRVSASGVGGATDLGSIFMALKDFVSRVPATGGASVSKFGTMNWSQTGDVSTPGPVARLEVSVPDNWDKTTTGHRTCACPRCNYLGDQGN